MFSCEKKSTIFSPIKNGKIRPQEKPDCLNWCKGPVTIFGQYQIHFENIVISNYPSVKLLYSEDKTVEAIG
jgi:hypothetical protein